MVSPLRRVATDVGSAWLWAVEDAEPLIEQLSPEQRSTVLASLAVVLVLGLALLTMIVAGARMLRRGTRQATGPSRMATDAWYEKPLVEPDLEERIDEHGN